MKRKNYVGGGEKISTSFCGDGNFFFRILTAGECTSSGRSVLWVNRVNGEWSGQMGDKNKDRTSNIISTRRPVMFPLKANNRTMRRTTAAAVIGIAIEKSVRWNSVYGRRELDD